MVPEPQHPVAFGLNHRRAFRIGFRGMLATVHLDHQLRPVAGKVDNEMTQRNLASPAGSRRDLAQQSPHRALRIGHLAAKFARAQDVAGWGMLIHTPLLTANSPPSKLR